MIFPEEESVRIMLLMTNQSSPECSSLLILQIYIFFTTVSKCHENNGHSAWCVGVLCVCYHLCPWNHMEGHIWLVFENHGGFCCCWCCCFFNSSWLLIIINEKRGKFLKKLWCCLSGQVYQDNLVLSIEVIRFKKMTYDILSVSPLSEQLGWQTN